MGSVVGSVVGGIFGSEASGNAADAQVAAANASSATQLQMYNQTREDQTPWRDAGKVALGQIGTGTKNGGEFNRNFALSDFVKDPGYQFRMSEGMRGLQNSAAARGGLLNGGTLKALSKYGQDYASNEYGNAYNRFNNDNTTRFNRLATIAGVGQTANNQIAQAGTNAANNISNNQLAAGNATASGYVGSANAINNGISNAQSMYQLNNLFNRNQSSGYSNSTSGATSNDGVFLGNGITGSMFS